MGKIKPHKHEAKIRAHMNHAEYVIQCSCGWREIFAAPSICRRKWREHPINRVDTWGDCTEE